MWGIFLAPDIEDGKNWYLFTALAKKNRMPYSTVVTWAQRKKLDVFEFSCRKYVVEKADKVNRS